MAICRECHRKMCKSIRWFTLVGTLTAHDSVTAIRIREVKFLQVSAAAGKQHRTTDIRF